MLLRTRAISVLALSATAALLTTEPGVAQSTGTIEGTAAAAETGEPLVGAQVSVPALGIGVLTGAEGQFVLPGVPAGTHELEAELFGAVAHLLVSMNVTVAAGGTVSVELLLEPTVLHLEGLVVTGTAFEESPVELPYAVAISGRRTLAEQGAPQAVDFFRNLGSSAGVLGDRQGWYTTRPAASLPETVASVNLRGIGPSRTLVLLNGRRQTYVPARLSGGRFVDVNAFPGIALDRIEVVKEGASAIYGSDAVAGVANFLTRSDFEGLEVSGAYEHFSGAGETQAGAIWGTGLGESAHAVFSAEAVISQELTPEERDWSLRPFTPGGGAWSYTGNPGAFLFPALTGDETREEFTSSLIDAQFGGSGGVFVDPRCEAFGGRVEGETCRFRYQPWDNLIQASRHMRAFAEVTGDMGDSSRYHVEALWAEATIPDWYTTPSYPPISPYNGAQVITPGHPGRREFCQVHGQSAGFMTGSACLEDDWYYYGRLVGNSGPGRTLDRSSRTQRISATLERDIESLGGREATIEVSLGYSRSSANANLPAEYAYRKFLAFRGFGGANCGVSVVTDPSSPSEMGLGALNGALAGQGNCMYYNPFSNAHQHSAQPGALYLEQPNPDYAPGLDNSPELIDWINEEVDLDSSTDLFVADALLMGTLVENVVDYAVGYQFRRVGVSALPNEPGDLSINPCAVPGDRTCLEKAGAFTFTTGHYEYHDSTDGPPSLRRDTARTRGPGEQPACGQLRVPRLGEQLRSQGGGPRGTGRAARTPRLGADDLPHPVGRRPQRGPQHFARIRLRSGYLQGGRHLRKQPAPAGTGADLQSGTRPSATAAPGHGRLLELRLPRRHRCPARPRRDEAIRGGRRLAGRRQGIRDLPRRAWDRHLRRVGRRANQGGEHKLAGHPDVRDRSPSQHSLPVRSERAFHGN